MLYGAAVGFLEQVSTSASALPTSDDLYGAAAAIFRLQDTYQLPAEAISSASVPQLHGSPPLTGNWPYADISVRNSVRLIYSNIV